MCTKSYSKECKEQWLDTKLHFFGLLQNKSCFSAPDGPQGLKLPDVMAAGMKGDIWKEPAVGVTWEPASANGTARWVCRDRGRRSWAGAYPPALPRSSPAWSGKAGAALQQLQGLGCCSRFAGCFLGEDEAQFWSHHLPCLGISTDLCSGRSSSLPSSLAWLGKQMRGSASWCPAWVGSSRRRGGFAALGNTEAHCRPEKAAASGPAVPCSGCCELLPARQGDGGEPGISQSTGSLGRSVPPPRRDAQEL